MLTGNESEVIRELTDIGMWGACKKKLGTAGLSAARPTHLWLPFFNTAVYGFMLSARPETIAVLYQVASSPWIKYDHRIK